MFLVIGLLGAFLASLIAHNSALLLIGWVVGVLSSAFVFGVCEMMSDPFDVIDDVPHEKYDTNYPSRKAQ